VLPLPGCSTIWRLERELVNQPRSLDISRIVIVILPISACCPGETSDRAALNSNNRNSFSFGFSGLGSNENHSQTVLCACGVRDLFPVKKTLSTVIGYQWPTGGSECYHGSNNRQWHEMSIGLSAVRKIL
jgi:hypothetical protein